ncbi:DUF374 domain-containing protein [bacterium]|nr:DUF374 domain-containing protein [bacterium]
MVESESLTMKRFLAWNSPPLIALFLRSLAMTLRFRVEDPRGLLTPQPDQPRIFAFWHNRILMMPYIYERFCPGRRMLMLVSRSRDGEFITRIMNRFGIDGVRGSSSKGGSGALREMVGELKKKSARDIGITPDGPRGPKGRVQDGVLAVSQASGLPIIPVTTHLSRKWELPSWDRFQIPQPGALCRLVVGPAVPAPKKSEPWEAIRQKLEKTLGD